MTVTPAEPSKRVVKIARYAIRCCRIYGNIPLRQILKKVLGASALVVNDSGIISLLCEMRPELIDQSAAVVWQSNLLGQVEIKAKGSMPRNKTRQARRDSDSLSQPTADQGFAIGAVVIEKYLADHYSSAPR
jgi:hypothetical protein